MSATCSPPPRAGPPTKCQLPCCSMISIRAGVQSLHSANAMLGPRARRWIGAFRWGSSVQPSFEPAEGSVVQRIWVVTLFGLLASCSSPESSGDAYDVKMGKTTCRYFKGVDRAPPIPVAKALDARGIKDERLAGKTICGDVTSWNLLSEGAGAGEIPPPGMYRRVSMRTSGNIVVSPDDHDCNSACCPHERN